MTDTLATIAVVPRERHSLTIETIQGLVEHTSPPYELLVVDGNSADSIRTRIESLADRHGFKVIRRDSYLTPNQARNLAWSSVTTKYVVFVDNDVIVTPGWLGGLVACAEETGAWAVSPLYLEGKIDGGVVHMAGGTAHIDEAHGRRLLHSRHRFAKTPLATVRSQVTREPTELFEFHCVLIRNDVRETLGPFDDQLMSLHEHIDASMQIRAAGGSVYLEPEVLIAYDISARFDKLDLPYFELRWSDEWNKQSTYRFRDKWKLAHDDPFIDNAIGWGRKHRRLATVSKVPWRLRTVAGRCARAARWVKKAVEGLIRE